MFISHYAVSLAAKKIKPELPLWLLLLGTMAVDFWSTINRQFELAAFYGHSLLFVGINMAVMAAAGLIFYRTLVNILILLFLPLSHFLMDLVTGKMQWWAGGPHIGLGLYSIPWLEFIIDSAIFAGCLVFYMRLFPKSKKRTIWFAVIISVFVVLQAAYNFFLS